MIVLHHDPSFQTAKSSFLFKAQNDVLQMCATINYLYRAEECPQRLSNLYILSTIQLHPTVNNCWMKQAKKLDKHLESLINYPLGSIAFELLLKVFSSR